MLTRRGWLLGLGAVLLIVTGRVLAMIELYMLAAAALALTLGALVFVRRCRFSLTAERELHPPRVHAGTASRVELAVCNQASRRSPVLSARDPFDGGRRTASFLIAPLRPGETARAAYRLPTEHRGLFDLGPLELHLGDPFGLATIAVEGAPATTLTVYPHVDPIEAPSLTRGQDPHAGAAHAGALTGGGEDFYGLREYEQGDDLRRVHWKATARLDELMIRQDEMPWQGRATVVVDLRAVVHGDESFEGAVSAAASIVSACFRRRSLVRLVCAGLDSGFGAGQAHVDALLEVLAMADPVPGAQLRPTLAALRREGNGGALTVVTTSSAGADDLAAATRLRTRFATVTVVVFERGPAPSRAAASSGAGRGPGGATTVVSVTADRPFAAAWAAATPGARLQRTATP